MGTVMCVILGGSCGGLGRNAWHSWHRLRRVPRAQSTVKSKKISALQGGTDVAREMERMALALWQWLRRTTSPPGSNPWFACRSNESWMDSLSRRH
jgi:hypothetical protein